MEKWEREVENYVNPPIPDFVNNCTLTTLSQLPRKKQVPKKAFVAASLFTGISILFGASILSTALGDTKRSIPILRSTFYKQKMEK